MYCRCNTMSVFCELILGAFTLVYLTSCNTLAVSEAEPKRHAPTFLLPTYIRQNVPEDAPIGYFLLNVTATDPDFGRNGELNFFVPHPFKVDTVGNIGVVTVNGRLDFDRTRGHRYEFPVWVTDTGTPSLAGSSHVVVLLTNVNDEAPEFETGPLRAEVPASAPRHQFVHTVRVTDPDGDNVRVFFSDITAERSGPFQITPDTGRIFLWKSLPSVTMKYVLRLVAEDDGLCCGSRDVRHRTNAILIVQTTSTVNAFSPEFPNCTRYNNNPPSVHENSPAGISVFQVEAVDVDEGDSGRIRYDLEPTQPHTQLQMDSSTGVLTVRNRLDVEEAGIARRISPVMVRASDQGNPSRHALCTFPILLVDVNDNRPTFSHTIYQSSVTRRAKAGTRVVRVAATDRDSGENGRVEYSLLQKPPHMFKIDRETGIVSLAVDMNEEMDSATVLVMAEDFGSPLRLNSTASVVLTVWSAIVAPPVWLPGQVTDVRVNETHPLTHNQPVVRLQATRADGGPVDFLFITDDQIAVAEIEPFAIFRPPDLEDVVDIYLRSSLDYESTELYKLKIRAAALGSYSDRILNVVVVDQNDETPLFFRHPGQRVTHLQAVDQDKSPAFRQLRFGFRKDQDGDISRQFSINAETGVITTMGPLDRDVFTGGVIRFVVTVDDQVPSADPTVPGNLPNSATATVEVVLLDENVYPPIFVRNVWDVSVSEDVDLGFVVTELQASDRDGGSLKYSLLDGRNLNDFFVEPQSGLVRVGKYLDFEDPDRRLYNLTVEVTDGWTSDTAQLLLHVLDANDNAPVFTESPYTVLNVYEESLDVNNMLIKVTAADADFDRPNDIEYRLAGRLADDGTFAIDKKTGKIHLLKKLDRDYPGGHEVFEFNVLAMDEPGSPGNRTGVSYIRVLPIDINDNRPVFAQNAISSWVPEGSTASDPVNVVLRVTAMDVDAGDNGRVAYSFANPSLLFGINSTTGEIFVTTTDDKALDREAVDLYRILVVAADHGRPTALTSQQLITIHLSDVNDNLPVFSQVIYRVNMSENSTVGQAILSVSASDPDIDDKGLAFRIENRDDLYYFHLETRAENNEGILRLAKLLDYENPSERSFNLTISVDDVISPYHKVQAYIEVTVEDSNDNSPEFTVASARVTVPEDIAMGTSLRTMTATDSDSGRNGYIDYLIERDSDPDRLFVIDQSGTVRLNKALDRETADFHNITVLAVDNGFPQLTGVAELLVTVLDVNDNGPQFAADYVIQFDGNATVGQTFPHDIEAVDLDLPRNGPPFHFSLPCKYGCPCDDNPTCHLFNMTFTRSPSKPNGFARVNTLPVQLQKDSQREYRMPIVMSDSGRPVKTVTNYLRIVRDDVSPYT